MDKPFRAGRVAIIGRPNVGKSTLLNALLGKKLSITSPKPQTTQEAIIGINTTKDAQIVYVDTPGFQRFSKHKKDQLFNREAEQQLLGVDLIVWVIDAERWNQDDDATLGILRDVIPPILIVVNKIDRLSEEALLPLLQKYHDILPNVGVVPVCAIREYHVDRLFALIVSHLPEQAALYPKEQYTDRDENFLLSEIVREKIMRITKKEVPYQIKIQIAQREIVDKVEHIHADILVPKDSYRAILLGEGGSRMKMIGEQARADIEQLLGHHIFLKLWVKVET